MPRMRQSSNTPQKTLNGKPDHYYVIMAQRRIKTCRCYSSGKNDLFLEEIGPARCYSQLGPFLTRKAAHKMIMEITHSSDWEHRNKHSIKEFFWAKRIDIKENDQRG
jgi:hypothetical protein